MRLLVALLSLAATAPAQDLAGADLYVPSKRRALVVGAGDYDEGALVYAQEDARAFARVLVEQLGFAPEDVDLLTDGPREEGEHPDDYRRRKPTATNIWQALSDATSNARGSDLFVFYYCGHGEGRANGDVLLPTDVQEGSLEQLSVPVSTVIEGLVDAEMRNVLIVIDACRTGAENLFGRELLELAADARLSVILGCEPGKQSYEDAYLGHGAFTYCLVEVLESGDAVDPVSGGLWASELGRILKDRVAYETLREDPPQTPVTWDDPTRDVLLGATFPAELEDYVVEEFLDQLQRLDAEEFRIAVIGYAEILHAERRYEECLRVLKSVEQLGPLDLWSRYLLTGALHATGKQIEARRVLDSIRAEFPNTPPAWIATIADRTGYTSVAERAEAADLLMRAEVTVSPGLGVLAIEALAEGGRHDDALSSIGHVLGGVPAGSRLESYLMALGTAWQGRYDESLELLDRTLARPGDYPLEEMVFIQASKVLAAADRYEEAVGLLDEAISRWPEQALWRVRRLFAVRSSFHSMTQHESLRAEAREILAMELNPEELFELVRIISYLAIELQAEIEPHVARHPRAWQAQVAGLFSRNPPDSREAMKRIADDLAPAPYLAYVAAGQLTKGAWVDKAALIKETLAHDDPRRAQANNDLLNGLGWLHWRLTPLADQFGNDARAWGLLADVDFRLMCYEPFRRRFLAGRGKGDTDRLSPGMARIAALASFNTGRIEDLAGLHRSAPEGSMLAADLYWLEATYVVGRGTVARVRELVEAAGDRPYSQSAGIETGVRAWLAAKGGDEEGARRGVDSLDLVRTEDLCLAVLTLAALEDQEGLSELLPRIDGCVPGDYYPLLLAARRALGVSVEEDLMLGAAYTPGNALFADVGFAQDPGFAAYTGEDLVFTIEEDTGPTGLIGWKVTLNVGGNGRVFGAVEAPAGSEGYHSIHGTLSPSGSLDVELVYEHRSEDGVVTRMSYTLLAKLAPRSAFAQNEFLQLNGQPVQVLSPEYVRSLWILRPAWE